MKEQSTRQLKVGQEIKEILSREFMRGDIYDPATRKSVNITISEVKVSPDLRNATVFYIPFGMQENHKSVQQSLEGVAGKLKGMIGKKMHLRNIPNFIFRIDNSFDEAKRMSQLLAETKDS